MGRQSRTWLLLFASWIIALTASLGALFIAEPAAVLCAARGWYYAFALVKADGLDVYPGATRHLADRCSCSGYRTYSRSN